MGSTIFMLTLVLVSVTWLVLSRLDLGMITLHLSRLMASRESMIT